MIRALAVFIFVLAAGSAAAGEDRLTGRIRTHAFQLDPALREISGLAPAGPDTVWAHDDEFAIIHEVSLQDGRIIRSFALGRPTAPGDFEGIAHVGDVIYLVTSKGVILEAPITAHGKRSRFNMYDTGAGDICNIEGLAPSENDGDFLLLCKFSRAEPQSQRLQIFEWSLRDRLAPARLVLDRPMSDYLPKEAIADFRPSDLYRDADTGDLFVLSVSAGILQIDRAGRRVAFQPLDPALHPQPEGMTMTATGALVVADEGKKGAGELAIYERR